MSSRALIALVLLVLLGSSPSHCFAKKMKNAAGADTDNSATIQEVSFASITVNTGDQAQMTYKITDQTTVTLNGVPATTEDLLAGMEVTVQASPDNKIAMVITAKNAKVIPNKH
jgi:hypothetical protein